MELRQKVRDFILNNFMMGRKANELGDSDSLLSKGILDSTGVLELVGFIEQNFKIAVDDDDLVPQNLDSVNNLVTYIKNKRQ